MKMKKCALGLVAMLAGVTALSACDLVTANDNGSIFTYTDALGNRVSYSANDLLANYQDTPSSLSTEFDKVYEVLVRHYYDSLKSPSTKLADLKALADRDVIKDKQTAKNNASSTSSYEAEFEKILTSHSVKNVSELYEYHLYEEEKTDFQNAIYQTWGTNDSAINGLEAMKDGYYTKDGQQVSIMQASTDANNYWGIGNSGWLLDQMPYHYRHILVKLASGKTGEFTQDKIGESTDGKGGDATKLSRLIFALAGANYASDVHSANKRTTTIESLPIRQSFGYLASQYSEDNSGSPASSTHQGETSIVTKVMSSDFVPEFKLGSYAYETLFNQRETSTDFGKANAYRIAPGLKKDAGTYVGTSAITTNMIDSNQTLEDGTTVYHEIEKTGLGQIPFGAAVALADMADTVKDVNGNTVNEGNEVFYPRNVIFNKYFNKHNICVITPNAIMSNSTIDNTTLGADLTAVADEHLTTDGTVTKQYYKGAYSTLFASLPGFQKDTTNVVSVTSDDGKAENVLTNSEGQIVLAVRVSSSGYQGIHFIVVERSGLSKFGLHTDSSGKVVENANEAEATANNVATSSQYYTTYLPDSTSYPVNKDNVQTYVDYNKPTSEDLTTRSGNIATAIKGYNSALSTYQFEMLVNNGSIAFNDVTLGNKMKSFSTI